MIPESREVRGWILYDGRCSICRGGARRIGCLATGRGYHLSPLQRHWVQREIARRPDPVGDEILLLLPDGRLLGGIDVFIHVGLRIWWGAPIALLAMVPGIHFCLRKLYAWVAANRYRFQRGCESGQCRVGH